METKPIVLDEEAQKAVDSAELLPATYEDYSISDALGYKNAGKALKEIKSQGKKFDDLRKSMTRPLDDSKKRIMDFFRKPANALKRAEGLIKDAMLAFSSEQERIRRAEEERLREAQRKEALRLEKLAAAARERDDEKKAAEFAKRQEAVESTQVSVAPIKAPKVPGVSMREIWTFEIEDASQIPRDYLIPDTKLIGDTARATKGKVKIPGVRIFSKKTLAAGGRQAAYE